MCLSGMAVVFWHLVIVIPSSIVTEVVDSHHLL